MLMRFTVSLQQRYEKVLNFKTYTSPAFYAKHVLKAGATKRYGLQTKCSVCLSVSPCAKAKTNVLFFFEVSSQANTKKQKHFSNNCHSVKRFCSVVASLSRVPVKQL
jgi:hypothetical protein